ncbi:MAG: acyl-CoA/acyl-ACP dehydrogenase [Rhodobacter sp.]|nr:acyl-CoA/acyl-ACP dehydrogenase [Rhodobacter sp.]
MDFQPSDDRRMLRDTLTRFLADRYGFEHRNAVAYSEPYHDPGRWAEMAELGVLHALAPEEWGGIGGAGFDIATVFEALGRALCPEPLLGALMAAWILGAAGAGLDSLLSGDTRYALAVDEAGGAQGIESIATFARRNDSGWVLNGRKSVVYGGGSAARLLVAARAGEALGVFLVDSSDAEITRYGMIDGGGAAELYCDNTPAERIVENGESIIRDALDHGALALCAEAVGAMDASAELLLDYLKTRKQFGRAIGEFQVLQHRMVDLMTEIEQARSITVLAASRMGSDGQSRTVSMAKSLIGRVAQQVAEELIQMHGGIAMTWEYPASHYAKRLVMIDHQLGDTDHHLTKVAAEYRG